ARRTERLDALVRLRRLVEHADAALERGTMLARSEVVAEGDAGVDGPRLRVVRVVGAHAGQQPEPRDGRQLGEHIGARAKYFASTGHLSHGASEEGPPAVAVFEVEGR